MTVMVWLAGSRERRAFAAASPPNPPPRITVCVGFALMAPHVGRISADGQSGRLSGKVDVSMTVAAREFPPAAGVKKNPLAVAAREGSRRARRVRAAARALLRRLGGAQRQV